MISRIRRGGAAEIGPHRRYAIGMRHDQAMQRGRDDHVAGQHLGIEEGLDLLGPATQDVDLGYVRGQRDGFLGMDMMTDQPDGMTLGDVGGYSRGSSAGVAENLGTGAAAVAHQATCQWAAYRAIAASALSPSVSRGVPAPHTFVPARANLMMEPMASTPCAGTHEARRHAGQPMHEIGVERVAEISRIGSIHPP